MKERHRLDYLDSLRGLAALAVLCGHYRGAYGGNVPSGKLLGWLSGMACDGFAAVTMFFVLSGFVLSLKYFQNHETPYSLWETLPPFVLSRLTRICLPFAFALAVSVALKHTLFAWQEGVPTPSAWIQTFWTAHDTVANVLRQLFLFLPAGNQHLVPQDWTLTVELNLSLCIPFLILVALVNSWALVFFSVIVVSLLKAPGFLIDFVLGIVIAKHFDSVRAWFENKRAVLQGLILLASLSLYGYRETSLFLPLAYRTPFKESWIWYVTALGSAGIMMSVMGSEKLRRLLGIQWLAYFGKISYSFYLLHFAVLLAITPRLLRITSLGWLGTVLVTTGLAAASYQFVELPSIRFGYFLRSLWQNQTATRP